MTMKRFVAIILTLMMLCLCGASLAESCPLPAVNTDAKIVFKGFDWYTDYNTTVSFASAKGIVNE